MTDETGRNLRVVTWNLWWRYGPWRERQAAIEKVLIEAAPDVLTLQEVWASPTSDFATHLAEMLGLHVAWSPNRRPERWRRRTGTDGEDVDIGNAVLSRWPYLYAEEAELPDGMTRPSGRTALGVVIDHPSGPLPVVTTHLTSDPAKSAVRVQQVVVVAELAASLVARATAHAGPAGMTFPPVVTGDLNAEADSDEVRRLSGLATAPAVDGLVLMDAWRFAEHGDPGWTWRRENAYLVEGNPDARIDHVLVGLGTGHGLGAVRSVGLLGAAAVDGVWPSDHAGVRVDLAATPRGDSGGR